MLEQYFPGSASGKEPPPMQETQETRSLSQEDPLEAGMATPSILA